MAARRISALVEVGAVMASNVRSVFGGLNRYIDNLGGRLAALRKASKDITNLQNAQARLARAQASGNAASIARAQAAVDRYTASLRAAGVNTANLAHEQDRLNAALSRGQTRLARFTGLNTAVRDLGSTFAKTRTQISGLMTKTAVAGAAAGYFFKTQFVDTAAEFERLQTVLKTLEGGDAKKAQQAFGWISKFAAETPFDLKQVTEAFKQLRTYGIDPIKGDTLRILGDTASAMGKDVMQPVEAIADAVMGENQRLKELGISANATKQKGKVTYTYFDRLGKQREKTVDASNKEIMKSTILAIWNEKYAGAMKDQSKTWLGMTSNLGDQWDRFTMRVMAGGLFDWMKGRLGGILETLDKMAEDGSLNEWAKTTGDNITKVFKKLEEWGLKIWDVTKATKELVGGWDNLGLVIAGIALAPTIVSLLQLANALRAVGVAMWAVTGPWGLLIGAIIGGAALIVTYWEPIKAFFADLWERVSHYFRNAWNEIKISWQKFKNEFSADWEGIKSAVGGAIDWITQKINGLIAAMQSLGTTTIGGIKLGDVHGTMMDLNPITGPARLMGRAVQSMMPADKMPAANGGTVTNNVNVKVDAPGADGQGIADKLRSALESRPLFDQTTVLSPR